MSTTQPKVKKYKFFDENLNEVTKDVPVSFNAYTDLKAATEALGNDNGALLKAINNFLQRRAFMDARAAVRAGGVSSKAVMTFIRPFREVAPYKDYEKRSEQTSAILENVRKSEFMVQAIKAASASETEDDDEDVSDE